MDHLIFYRESNKFDDILADPTIKKCAKTKISCYQHLILGLNDDKKIMSYAILKYGEDIISFDRIAPDRSPVPGKDYEPKRKNKGP